ncbi:MAG: DEAD/DEAH box helicase [Bacillaceae bacterium]|nr:DEAD/DEAH box helicase [Bacillaceae bacterium]
MTFEQLGLKKEVLQGVKSAYYKEPTPIQEKAIPLILEGKDVIGQAQTGTGKTAAFVLPILHNLDPNKKDVQALILTPTRELALQIVEDVRHLGQHLDIGVISLHGGQDISRQINRLEGKKHIVVGTPGRINDHLNRGTVHFGRIRTLVLDEADKMLEMGFREEVEEILYRTAADKQVLLFSATMPEEVKKLAHRFMKQPPHVKIKGRQATAETTRQYYYLINQSEKWDALMQVVEEEKPFLCIIFANTRRRVDQLTARLQENGFEAEALHGDLSQRKRQRLMEQFRDVKFQYLVATDVAARGLDIEGVTHVINYDIPSDKESYIHRVGRTGRAGEEGVAISFVTPRQKVTFKRIEKGIKGKIEERWININKFI